MKLYMHDSLTYNYVPRCDPDSVPHTTAVVSLAMPMLGSPLTASMCLWPEDEIKIINITIVYVRLAHIHLLNSSSYFPA